MSIQAVGWAFQQADIPARAKFVLVSIANHADYTDGYCYLRADTIASEAACSPRAVFNFVGDLIRNGYIRKAPRKGDDGKQRANDYWILFDREPAKWIGDRPTNIPDDEGEAEPDTISGEPHASRACGENENETLAEPPETAHGAVGPHAPPCIRKDSEEPSESNLKKKDGAKPFAAPPRKYLAPPIAPEKPQGALHPDASKPIFVYMGTPAWDAWMAHKLATTGHRWTLTKTTIIEGEKRTGWWFPTLFPPSRGGEKGSGEDDDPELAKLQESRMHR